MIRFVLIGGKDNFLKNNNIENKLIEMTNKKSPEILYFPTANKNENESILKFKNYISDFSIVHFLDLENYDKIYTMIKNSDIIYFGPGDARYLIFIIKKYKIDIILKEFCNSDKIYAGISAGAIMLSSFGMGDSESYNDNFHTYNYKMIDGLGLINISICPHYQKDDLIIYNDEVKKYKIDSFALEDDTAIVFKGNEFYLIKSFKNRNAFHFSYIDNYKMILLNENVIYSRE